MPRKKHQDRRLTRTEVEIDRRRKPYVYEYEVKEIAELLNITRKTLQEMINDRVEDYQMMMSSAHDGSKLRE